MMEKYDFINYNPLFYLIALPFEREERNLEDKRKEKVEVGILKIHTCAMGKLSMAER